MKILIYLNIYIDTIYLKLEYDNEGNVIHDIYANQQPKPIIKIKANSLLIA